ncbi:hypothetical protein PRUPE_5G155200 [Prunus persica]|uniref:Uncharacterized protein n=1 Tax=Prunus persica TaxID=3760 RepID=A0A251P8Y3_PRUPE|nr:hypothetical protein PRUPE_5G155200 [Prunus persica]
MRPWNMVIDPAFDHLVIQGSRSGSSELQIMSIHYGDCLREAVRGQKLSMKFRSARKLQELCFSNGGVYISGSVSTLDGCLKRARAELSKCSIRTVCLD